MNGATAYPRDMAGYGRNPPDPQWPGGARIAIQLALNYEGGGESNILHGDPASEFALTDTGLPAYKGRRAPYTESSFEYGSRVGTWRLLRISASGRLNAAFSPSAWRSSAIRRSQSWHTKMGMRWSDMAIVGSITSRCPRPKSAITSLARWRLSGASPASVRLAG